jgi:hypothetical protein
VGVNRILAFWEFTLLNTPQMKDTWEACFGPGFTDEAAALGYAQRNRSCTSYPTMHQGPPPVFVPYVLPDPFTWPSKDGHKSLAMLSPASQRSQQRGGYPTPPPWRSWTATIGVYLYFGGKIDLPHGRTQTWDSLSPYEQWSVTAYTFYDHRLGTVRFFPRWLILAGFGLDLVQIRRLIEFRPCKEPLACGILFRPCEDCTFVSKLFGQAWNKDAMRTQLERLFGLWSTQSLHGQYHLQGFSSPIHVCGSACPHKQDSKGKGKGRAWGNF